MEWGTEEFHIAGFVQESVPASAGRKGERMKFRHYAELNPDGPRDMNFDTRHTFHLNNPDQPDWPRAYNTVISILEEDGGDSLPEWESDVWLISDDMLQGQIADMVEDYLEEHRDELIKAGISEGIEMAKFIASIASSTAGAIVGMIAAIAAMIITNVILDMADDFYGVEAFSLVMPTNDVVIVDSLGANTSAKIDFYGAPGATQAGWYAGRVEIGVHWKFDKKEYY